jgi:ABC-type antimicrobial peptide transport system permease subunit
VFNIVLAEWDHQDTILFLQGSSPEYLGPDVLNVLIAGLHLACGAQIVSVTFGLLCGAFFEKRGLLTAWIWFQPFQLALYVIYLFAGVLVYSIVGDRTKVTLLLYGFVNILIGMCAWKMALEYSRHLDFV